MKFIGIDIAKSTFVAAYPLPTGGYRTKTYPNDPKGVKLFMRSFSHEGHHCVLEATGNYGMLLLYMLCKTGVAVSQVNPKQIKHFARMMMTVTKTDDVDAKLISLYGEKMSPPVYRFPAESLLILKQKKVIARQLRKQMVALSNLKESLQALPLKDKASLKSLDKTLHFLKARIEEINADIADVASGAFEQQIASLTSIKGIGISLATSLVISTGGFSQFETSKQLARFVGICPSYQQSGSSINIRGTISRNGDSNLRSLLYIASWSAIRYNQTCKETYERLKARGKPSKVALVAVANKLLRQAFAICKSNSRYVDGYKSTLNKNAISSCFLT